ncbi:MAG: DUF4145 domain-containing protein [Pseudolabrys sp.]
MDGYQFFASIIQSVVSLAWPLAFVAAVWLFREKIAELLPRFRAKYKDLELSFRLDQAEKEAAALPPAPASTEAMPTAEERSKFDQIAEISPRAAILEVRSGIEEAVRSLALNTKLLTPRVQSFLGLTRLLRSREVIDSQTSALLDDLRVVGNNAAHNPISEFTKEEALRYRKLADQVIARLRVAELIG